MLFVRPFFITLSILACTPVLADDASIAQVGSSAISRNPPHANAENVKLEDMMLQPDYQQDMLANPYANGYAQMQEISGTGPVNTSSQSAEGDYAQKRIGEDDLLSPATHREIADSLMFDERESTQDNNQLLGGRL